jgi:hypothetical protein
VVQVGLDAVDVQTLAEVEGRRQRRERKHGGEPRGGQHFGVWAVACEGRRERADMVGVPCGSVTRDTRFAKSVSAGIKGSVREGEGRQRAFVRSWKTANESGRVGRREHKEKDGGSGQVSGRRW